jgi:hypothetical protein
VVAGLLVYRGRGPSGIVEARQSGHALHLYVPDARDTFRGAAQVELQAPAKTFSSGASRAAAVVAFILTLFTIFAGPLGRNDKSSATLLLLLPGLIAAYVFRPGEHLLTSRLLRWSRRSLLLAAACAYAAAGWLLVAPDDKRPSLTKSARPAATALSPATPGRATKTSSAAPATAIVRSVESRPSTSSLRLGWGLLAAGAWVAAAVLWRTRRLADQRVSEPS